MTHLLWTSFQRTLTFLLTLFCLTSFSMAEDTAFQWTGKGDGATWSDPANWAGNTVPYGQGSFGSSNRPDTNIEQEGADVTIQSRVPKAFGHINVGAAGKGTTLNIIEGGALATQGSMVIGENDTTGHFNMSGGWLEIGVWGARDLRIDNGSMVFGSDKPETAPSITISPSARGLSIAGANKSNVEVTLQGHGSIVTAQRAVFSIYGRSTINVIGGNLNLDFGAENPTESNIGGKNHPSYHLATFNYTLDAAGASTMKFGGDVLFGVCEFNLDVADDFEAKPGDVFTIVSAKGDFIGNRAFGNVPDGATLTAGDYKFKAAYAYSADGEDRFTLTVQGE